MTLLEIGLTLFYQTAKDMKTVTVKIQDVREGNYFVSKGSKMIFSQIRKETDTHITVYVMQCLMSSYTTVTFAKNQDVELLIK